MEKNDLFEDTKVASSYIYEALYFACGLVFEDHYSYPYVKSQKEEHNSNNSKGYNNTLEDRIILMHNTQLIKFFLVILGLIIYGIVLYFGYLYSNMSEYRIELNLKKFFSYYYHIFMIIIADIFPFLFIYPYISDYSSCYVCLFIGILVNI